MQFVPYVYDNSQNKINVSIQEMTSSDAERTNEIPLQQTSWTSEYLLDDRLEKYSVKHNEELIALGAYEIMEQQLVVHIVYMEAQPESNPNLDNRLPKYNGIGRLLIAYGIKLSIDNGLTGDVVLEAKTSELERHYIKDFGAVKLPTFRGAAQRLLIADEAAKRIFFGYLK